jgi:hypothetical protein
VSSTSYLHAPKKKNKKNLPHPSQNSCTLLKHIRTIARVVDQIMEMVLQCLFIWFLDALQDLENDAAVARVVEVNFLVVGDLADIAGMC